MTRLVVTADAAADTSEILNHLEKVGGPRVAERYGRRLRLAIERAVYAPRSGAPRPVFGPYARMIVVYPYVLIYDYTRNDDTLTLLRILHGRRNITPTLVRGGLNEP
jgi:plasmid stabilization system protein ParE